MPSVTLTFTIPIAQRISAAVGQPEYGRNATEAEVKLWLEQQLRQRVRNYEWRLAKEALTAPTEIEIG